MHLRLPETLDSDFVIDCASISSFFSDNSDFHDGIFDSPIIDGDFSEYMWMENADEFDKEVMQQLEEEALMEECMEAMLEEVDEEDEDSVELRHLSDSILQSSYQSSDSGDENFHLWTGEIIDLFSLLRVQDKSQPAINSTLNPNAAEFIPQQTVSEISLNNNLSKFT